MFLVRLCQYLEDISRFTISWLDSININLGYKILNNILVCVYFPFPCVYREEATPSSIPNLAVKLLFADDTAPFRCGNVGRCKVKGKYYINPPLSAI